MKEERYKKIEERDEQRLREWERDWERKGAKEKRDIKRVRERTREYKQVRVLCGKFKYTVQKLSSKNLC